LKFDILAVSPQDLRLADVVKVLLYDIATFPTSWHQNPIFPYRHNAYKNTLLITEAQSLTSLSSNWRECNGFRL